VVDVTPGAAVALAMAPGVVAQTTETDPNNATDVSAEVKRRRSTMTFYREPLRTSFLAGNDVQAGF
jgi:hypothetical protein